MQITQLTQSDALSKWPILSPMFERAMATGQGESTLVDYMRKILSGMAQVWVVTEGDEITGAGLTEFMQYGQHRTLHVICFTGKDFEQQFSMIEPVREYAKANGAVRLEMWGRGGWPKMMAKVDPRWKPVYTVMSMDL